MVPEHVGLGHTQTEACMPINNSEAEERCLLRQVRYLGLGCSHSPS